MKLTREYKRGTALFHQGEPCNGAFVVLRGKVSLWTGASSARSICLKIPETRPVLALAEVIGGGPHQTTAVARTDVAVHFIPKRDVISMMTHDAAMGMQVLRMLTGDVSTLYRQIKHIGG